MRECSGSGPRTAWTGLDRRTNAYHPLRLLCPATPGSLQQRRHPLHPGRPRREISGSAPTAGAQALRPPEAAGSPCTATSRATRRASATTASASCTRTGPVTLWIGTLGRRAQPHGPGNTAPSPATGSPRTIPDSLSDDYRARHPGGPGRDAVDRHLRRRARPLRPRDRENSPATAMTRPIPASLSNDYVFCIHEDRDGAIWVGDLGRRAEPAGQGERARSAISPRPTAWPATRSAESSRTAAGNLWLTTNEGLSRFSPRTRQFRNYDASDGLQGKEFISGSVLPEPGRGDVHRRRERLQRLLPPGHLRQRLRPPGAASPPSRC